MDIWALQLHSMVKEAPIEECKKVLQKMQVPQAIEYLKNKYSELRKENIELLKEAFPEKSYDFINKVLDETNNDINKALLKFYNNPESLEQNIKSGAIPKNTHEVHMRKRRSSNSSSKLSKTNPTDTSNNDTKKGFLLLNASTKNKTKTNSATSSNDNDNKNSHLSSTSIQQKTNQKISSNDNTKKSLLLLSSSIKNKTKTNPPTSSNDNSAKTNNQPLLEKLKPKPWIASHKHASFGVPSQKVSQSTLLPRMEIPQNKIESEWNKSHESPFSRANNNAYNPILVNDQNEYEYSDSYSQYDYFEGDYDNDDKYDYNEEDQNNNGQDDFESQQRDNHLKTETIDLHGLVSKEARFIVEASLSQAKKNGIGVFRFITGIGNHSTNNIPILRPLVLEICKKYNCYAYIPEKNQGFVVCNVCKPFQ